MCSEGGTRFAIFSSSACDENILNASEPSTGGYGIGSGA